jgi:hypothetical protein
MVADLGLAIFNTTVALTFVIGGLYVDYRLWRWVIRKAKEERRAWREDA